ncbi:hypothetical protein BAE44_0010680 [Dichanthelium oligosanthes]|uniref:Uncharacterized protein n=1 Tax=Dichanthelium oligosanthes TaxID=888268 RepID=A0A1E5VT50_9POAL|nr:hypothetical protein BAE44_0010680 [Dichanthelium oligosanthes]
MAREGVRANHLRQQPEEEIEEAVVGANGQRRFVDAGRVLMLWGWGELAAVSTAGTRRSQPDASSAVHAFLGLVLWLLGVSLVGVAIVPVARRFPRAARVGAAVANGVIDCFFPPLN